MIIGMDLFAEGLQYAHHRMLCHLVQGDVHKMPFGIQFDVIGLFDVLEHLPNDTQVLRNLHASLVQGGRLLLTVPAHSSLWSYFDEESHHCRRYELTELQNKLMYANYKVEYITPYMSVIFPLVWLRRRLMTGMGNHKSDTASHKRNLASGELRITPVVNDLLCLLLAQEANMISRRRRLPIGTSLLAIARK